MLLSCPQDEVNPVVGMIRSLALAFGYETQSGLRIQSVDLPMESSINLGAELTKLLKSWPKASELALRAPRYGMTDVRCLECRVEASLWEDPSSRNALKHVQMLGSEGALGVGMLQGKNVLAWLPPHLARQVPSIDTSEIIAVEIPSSMRPEWALGVVRDWLWPHAVVDAIEGVDKVCLQSSNPEWKKKIEELLQRKPGSCHALVSEQHGVGEAFILDDQAASMQIKLASSKSELMRRHLATILDNADFLGALRSTELDDMTFTKEGLMLSDRASYVVVGGTRGLGLEMAKYLVANGGHVVVVGRRASAA